MISGKKEDPNELVSAKSGAVLKLGSDNQYHSVTRIETMQPVPKPLCEKPGVVISIMGIVAVPRHLMCTECMYSKDGVVPA